VDDSLPTFRPLAVQSNQGGIQPAVRKYRSTTIATPTRGAMVPARFLTALCHAEYSRRADGRIGLANSSRMLFAVESIFRRIPDAQLADVCR
jgi:hypothetical protein